MLATPLPAMAAPAAPQPQPADLFPFMQPDTAVAIPHDRAALPLRSQVAELSRRTLAPDELQASQDADRR
jgi:hypothetical protein